MKEHDIRPKELMARYVELCVLDAERCFSVREMVVKI